jgi:hypothetical protein
LGFLLEKCNFSPLDKSILDKCDAFDCNHDDLNDFFKNDVLNYSEDLLGRSYCFTLEDNPETIVCAFTVSNDSIKTKDLPNSRKKAVTKRIPQQKRMKSYPAVLIGRLGVNKNYRMVDAETTGDQLMDFIKSWFKSERNKTGCRFVVVDSYNEEKAKRYYERNGFSYLFSTEDQEKEYTRLDPEEVLKTRFLLFDLILLSG